ncbi:MAG: hypothetical protein V4509_00515 [Patescibacteria group bacterium]
MTKTPITFKEAKEKYGIVNSAMQRLDKVRFYLLDNGNVVDSMGDIRYIAKKPKVNEYNRIIDALNYIDEMVEHSNITYDEQKRVAKAYNKVANFIDKHAKG